MFQSSQIAELRTRIATLEGEVAAEKAASAAALNDLTETKSKLETAEAAAAEVPGLKEKITTHEATITAEKARADKAEADLKAANEAADAKIEAEVVNRLAAAGVDPIKRDPKAKTDEPNSTEGLTGLAKSRAALAAKAKKPAK